jgi:hypothetical protein
MVTKANQDVTVCVARYWLASTYVTKLKDTRLEWCRMLAEDLVVGDSFAHHQISPATVWL